MNYILGVDGGGIKTTVQIATISGEKVSGMVSGSSSYKSVGIKEAIENLNTGIFSAIKNLKSPKDIFFASSCFGFAGNNNEGDIEIYKRIVFNNRLSSYLDPKKTIICNDTRIGLELGSENKNKIIIIAGTGSNCFGVNQKGEKVKANGWDYILADEGSGYQVGLKALKAVMRAYDGRGKKTLLSKTILKEKNLKNIIELTKWTYEDACPKGRIGSLAKTVCETAEMGDKASIQIFKEESEEVIISINTVAQKLGFKNKNFDLVFVGGLFKCEKYFKNIISSKLKKIFPGINFMPLLANPAAGAVALAIKNM